MLPYNYSLRESWAFVVLHGLLGEAGSQLRFTLFVGRFAFLIELVATFLRCLEPRNQRPFFGGLNNVCSFASSLADGHASSFNLLHYTKCLSLVSFLASLGCLSASW
jgi:hypothetical protein